MSTGLSAAAKLSIRIHNGETSTKSSEKIRSFWLLTFSGSTFRVHQAAILLDRCKDDFCVRLEAA